MPPPLAFVLHGEIAADPPPDERDTLVQAAVVADALETLGFRVETLALGLDLSVLARRLRERPVAVVFNLVEAIGGDGRLVHLAPALLESRGAAFTGCGTVAMMSSTNKVLAKRLMAASDIPTPALWPAVAPGEPDAAPYIVKSVWEHASIGLDGDSVLPRAGVSDAIAARRRAFGGDWFAERFIDGREFNVGLIAGPAGPQVLPIAEMEFRGFSPGRPHIVDYAAKWHADSDAYRGTVRRFDLPEADRALLARLSALATACWTAFGLAGYARVDFRVDSEGRPWVLEVNANPCIAPDSGMAAAAAVAGLDVTGLVRRIVEDALDGAPLPVRKIA